MDNILKCLKISEIIPDVAQEVKNEKTKMIYKDFSGDGIIYLPQRDDDVSLMELPEIVFKGTTIVITRKIAKACDTAYLLGINGFSADILEPNLTTKKARVLFEKLINNMTHVLYAAPECVLVNDFINLLQSVDLKCFIVLNAHESVDYTDKYGSELNDGDNKGDEYYSNIHLLKKLFRDTSFLAVAPACMEAFENDIISALGLLNVKRFGPVMKQTLDEPSVAYHQDDHLKQQMEPGRISETLLNYGTRTRFYVSGQGGIEKTLIKMLEKRYGNDKGLVYVTSKNRSEKLAKKLLVTGMNPFYIHCGFSNDESDAVLNRFVMEKQAVLIAPIGCGPLLPRMELNYVIHLGIPQSISEYDEDIALGPGGLYPREANIFFDLSHVSSALMKAKDKTVLRIMFDYLESVTCRLMTLNSGIGKPAGNPCGICDICVNGVETVDAAEKAKLAIRAVLDTRERFGALHLSNVLTGKKNEKITYYGHDRLSIFGSGKDYTLGEWKTVFIKLLTAGILQTDMEHKGGFFRTEKTLSQLESSEPFYMINDNGSAFSDCFADNDETKKNGNEIGLMVEKIENITSSNSIIHPDTELQAIAFKNDFFHFPDTDFVSDNDKRCNSRDAIHEENGLTIKNPLEGNLAVEQERVLDEMGIGKKELALIEKAFRGGEKRGRNDIRSVYHDLDGKYSHDILRCAYSIYIMKKDPAPSIDAGYTKRIVLLAAARCFNRYLIAGKEMENGGYGPWIRPVSSSKNGVLGLKHILFPNGRMPKLMDITTIAFKMPDPHYPFGESHIIDETVHWKKNGKLAQKEVSKLIDDTDTLWINGFNSNNGFNDCIPAKLCKENVFDSLLLIRPEKTVIKANECNGKIGGLTSGSFRRITVNFLYNGVGYSLESTDIGMENLFYEKPACETITKDSGIMLCVTLNEPYYGFCYKTVVGIIEAP